MSTISLDDPQALEQLKALLETDEEFSVSSGDKTVKLKRVTDETSTLEKQPRVPGRWAHLNISMSPDFDDELPDSFWFPDEK